MPQIAMIRGFGEGYVATGFVIRLIKALNKRFRSKLHVTEIAAGDYSKFGCELTHDALDKMRECDSIYIGDMSSGANPLEYSVEDIALAFSDDTEYTCISGYSRHSDVNVTITNYFDGGFKLRDGQRSDDGVCETRVCSTYTAMNIVKHICRECEQSRRRLAFVKDGDNEYCADLFSTKFIDLSAPLSNFHFIRFTLNDITSELLYDPSQFDYIFASKTFAEIAKGIYQSRLGEYFGAYNKYSRNKSIYAPKAHLSNSESGDYVPSICSYITALADMLEFEFNMQKEAVALRLSLERTLDKGIDTTCGEEFISSVIEELNRPISTKFSKAAPKSRYIK